MHTVAHAVTKSAFSLHSSNAVHGHIKVILGKFLFGAAIPTGYNKQRPLRMRDAYTRSLFII